MFARCINRTTAPINRANNRSTLQVLPQKKKVSTGNSTAPSTEPRETIRVRNIMGMMITARSRKIRG